MHSHIETPVVRNVCIFRIDCSFFNFQNFRIDCFVLVDRTERVIMNRIVRKNFYTFHEKI